VAERLNRHVSVNCCDRNITCKLQNVLKGLIMYLAIYYVAILKNLHNVPL
jgi:hypothetical protein